MVDRINLNKVSLERVKTARAAVRSPLKKYNAQPVIAQAKDRIAQLRGFGDFAVFAQTREAEQKTFFQSVERGVTPPVAMRALIHSSIITDSHHNYDKNLGFFIGLEIVMEILFAGRRGLSVLQLASGYGPYVYYLREVRGINATGIDMDPYAVQYATETGIPVVEGDAGRLPFVKASFDVVLSHNFLDPVYLVGASEFFINDVLAEVSRVLKPGGRFISSSEVFGEMGAPADKAWRPFGFPQRFSDRVLCASHTLETVRLFFKPAPSV